MTQTTPTTGTPQQAAIDWPAEAIEQLDSHWQNQLRPRLEGLTDEEYFWEPTPRTWSVRPRGTGRAAMQAGAGAMTIDFEIPEPEPAPVTTISWRLGHVIVGVLAARNASHFGGPPVDYESFTYAETAAEALEQLDHEYSIWLDGVRGWQAEGSLAQPIGPAEGPWADRSRATLVLHINRELIHHGAEIALLRDLFANQPKRQDD